MMIFLKILSLWMLLIFYACAGHNTQSDAEIAGDAPCAECGTQGEIELKIENEIIYKEWNLKAFKRFDSTAVLGVFPALKVSAKRPEKCKMCHSFSEDALDFDLAHVEDSLMILAFPKMQRELMLPGMRVREEDSLFVETFANSFLKNVWADNKALDDFTPWKERAGIEQLFERDISQKLKNDLEKIASEYALRYISIPLHLEVAMDPSLGRSGGYDWKIIWSFWDARYGELVFLIYSDFRAVSTGRVAPEKEWAYPFAARLSTVLFKDLNQIENH